MISANDLKIKGVKLFEEAFKSQEEVGISIRGKVKYVVIKIEKYDELRELELDKALLASNIDIKNGDFTTSLMDHFNTIELQLKK